MDIDGDARREVPLKDGLVLAGGRGEIADTLRAAAPLDHERTARILGVRVACLDPVGRRLGLVDGGRTRGWFGVATSG